MGNATAAATDLVTSAGGRMEDGHTGVVLPVRMAEYITAIREFSAGQSPRGQLCALAWVASNVIHELVHLCAEAPDLGVCDEFPFPVPGCDTPGAASDALTCWSVQNMVAMTFLWALGQRFPGLARIQCCPKVADAYFADSEPDAAPEGLGWTPPC